MKRLLHLIVIVICLSPIESLSETALYSVSSRDQGILAFDLSVREIKREPRKSEILVPGFHDRSAAGSRWLMCAYADLTRQRGFENFIVVYPPEGSDKLIIGFPQSETEEIVKTLGPEFAGDSLFPDRPTSIEPFMRMCGMSR